MGIKLKCEGAHLRSELTKGDNTVWPYFCQKCDTPLTPLFEVVRYDGISRDMETEEESEVTEKFIALDPRLERLPTLKVNGTPSARSFGVGRKLTDTTLKRLYIDRKKQQKKRREGNSHILQHALPKRIAKKGRRREMLDLDTLEDFEEPVSIYCPDCGQKVILGKVK